MGAGYHGGFGKTVGCSYRLGNPIQISMKTFAMALDPMQYIHSISKKYNIHLKGSGKTINIIFDKNLKLGIYGKTYESNPLNIYVGPSALSSEYELANTIAHELNHARRYLKGLDANEEIAYKSGDMLEEYIKGER